MNAPDETPTPTGSLFEPWRLILRVAILLRDVVKREADSASLSALTLNQMRILGRIVFQTDKADDIRIGDLARDLGMSAAAAGQAIDRMVQSGLVERRTSSEDRRALVLSLSPNGKKIFDKHERLLNTVTDDLLRDTDAEDLAAFDRVMKALYAGLLKKQR